MAQIQTVDLQYIKGNAGITIFLVCFLAHPTSSSYRCFFTANKQFAHEGFSCSDLAFQNRPEVSHTARKKNFISRSASGSPGRCACLTLKQCFKKLWQTEQLSNDKSPSYSQKAFLQAVFTLFIFLLFTHFLPAYYSVLISSPLNQKILNIR